jgi:hypothetical protein
MTGSWRQFAPLVPGQQLVEARVRQRVAARSLQPGADGGGGKQIAGQGLGVQLGQRVRFLPRAGKVTMAATAAARRPQALGSQSVVTRHPAPDADLRHA